MNGLKPVSHRRSDALTRVGWDQLEVLLAAYYRSEGYEVEHVGTGATDAKTDGGIDLKLRRDEQFIVVQCKHWNAMKVPHNAVHELLGLMVNHGATGAILANSGEFTKAAIEAATKLGHVQLIDGNELRMMLGPIREPAPAFDVRMGGVDGVGSAMARRVGERLLSAAEDRIRYGSGGRGRRTATRSIAAVIAVKLLGAALFLALMLVLYLFVWRTLQSALTPARPPVVAAPAAPPVAKTAATSTAPNPCHEVIDAPSGTYIDHCATTVASRPSAAQVREQQRRAEEAMKVIAESTPEL
ncbi:restriction endonuclease [Lysobacter sp. FW306-1B-D06B]|uniref:restriction endonuclease n=1 Tax=Lysobacter sp. FW306-1B-D06B TaxID=3140250 RepID=UPI00314009E1